MNKQIVGVITKGLYQYQTTHEYTKKFRIKDKTENDVHYADGEEVCEE